MPKELEQKKKKRKTKADVLSNKEKMFSKIFAKNGNATDAAMIAYDVKKRSSASSMGSAMLKKPKISRAIDFYMEEAGLTEDVIVQKIQEGLSANLVGDYKGVPFESDIPDQKVRHKYLNTAIDIKGLKAPQKIQSVNIDIELDNLSVDELLALITAEVKILKQ